MKKSVPKGFLSEIMRINCSDYNINFSLFQENTAKSDSFTEKKEGRLKSGASRPVCPERKTAPL